MNMRAAADDQRDPAAAVGVGRHPGIVPEPGGGTTGCAAVAVPPAGVSARPHQLGLGLDDLALRAGRAVPGHQARSPSSTRAAGSITSRISVASIRIDAASATPIIFISSMLRVMKMANTDTITAAALVITPAVSVMPRSHREPGGQAAGGVLADPGQDEHVVVHRQPDQDHHHEQREPVDHEARGW